MQNWFDISAIEIFTPNGNQIVDKLYFNGYEPTLHLVFSNGENDYEIDCTFNHSFRTAAGEWIQAEYIEPTHLFDNGFRLVSGLMNEDPIPTWDISVPQEHCYILENGMVSHNTSLLMGGISEGINPDPAMTYTQMTSAGEIDRINPILLNIMKEKNVYSKTTMKHIGDKQGSVQHVTWLTEEEKKVFKTAFEINQESVLRLASVRSKFVDQWMSLNLFFAADEDPAWISKIHKKAFEDENILGLYYVYTMAGVQGSKEDCESCM
jgi:hypothetical protein